jgi:hypothetical protein
MSATNTPVIVAPEPTHSSATEDDVDQVDTPIAEAHLEDVTCHCIWSSCFRPVKKNNVNPENISSRH